MAGAALFFFLASASANAPPQSDYLLSAPKQEVVQGFWPKDSDGKPIYGYARLSCSMKPNRHVGNCSILEEAPAARGIGDSALRHADQYQVRFDSMWPAPSDGRVTFKVSYSTDTNAEWLSQPTLDELSAALPLAAASRGYDGQAILHCTINLQGLLQNCAVAKESPRGYGVGQAALTLVPALLFKPATRNGQPVETEEDIPIFFPTILPTAGISLPRILPTTAWSKTPSVPEILSEIDKKVGDKFADGKVVLQCQVIKATGRLKGCGLINASPGMVQFQDVAKSLTDKFEADPKSLPRESGEMRVFLQFSFPDMASPGFGQRYVTHVQWTSALSPTPDRPLFPEEAAKAGLKDGSALVDCQIGADGVVSGCQVLSESTPGMGFGAMAKTIAEGAVANRWTEEGLPVEGARVKLPITMTAAAPKP